MCGICGFIERPARSNDATLGARVRSMSATLRHRGPDAEGAWVDERHGVALGHRRLAVLDLGETGAQPMQSADGRFVLSYNGELYGHVPIRKELEVAGRSFRGHSDTEVLVEAIAFWGIEGALERIDGMFAFALWDRHDAALTLVRDRVGKKPLYYGETAGHFFFASELKALHAHAAFAAEIDRDALAFFVQHSYVPAPLSIYRDIRKLRAGERVTLRPNAAPVEERWWSPASLWTEGAATPLEMDLEGGIRSLGTLLEEAVSRRMVTDVPLGALLSGGIDSSLVVAMMTKASPRPVRTFTIGFGEADYNEAEHARRIATYLGTQHTELIATAEAARAVIPLLPELYDEPFADTSQIPTYLAARLAREHVTVALSGDGGDELFAGYTRYFRAIERWRALSVAPRGVRRLVAATLERVAPSRFDRATPQLRAGSLRDVFVAMNARCPDPSRYVLGDLSHPHLLDSVGVQPELDDPLEWMMFVDYAGRLGNSMLTKIDRASMGVGLEIRCPLLDPAIARWACQAPRSWKVRGGAGKWILHQLLERELPKALFERPKMGFGIPIGEWLRGPLRDWAETLLDEARLRREGFFDAGAVRRVWLEHLARHRDRRFLLWNILMFQAWLEHQRAQGTWQI